MKNPLRVLWTEGMFMAPQHLQQQDLFHEGATAARLAALHAFEWGAVAVELDREALAAGQLQLRRFTGVLPDGLALSFEAGQAGAPSARAIDALFPAKQRTLEVFLSVPRDRAVDESAPSQQPTGEGGGTPRYLPVTRPVADAQGGAEPAPVAFAQPRVKLLVGNEPRDDQSWIQIAELTRDATGGLIPVESFIPPALKLAAAPSVIEGMRRVLRTMVSKQRELADARRFRDAAAVEQTLHDVTRLFQQLALNGIIPVLHHLVDTPELSPHLAYRELIRAAGSLSTFSADGDPSGLPAFQHQNLRATFEPLFERIQTLLSALALEPCLPIELEARAGGLYLGRLEDERLPRCQQVLLAVRSPLDPREVADQLPRLAKIGARDEVPNLVRASSPGVPLLATLRPPPQVAVKPGVIYFQLSLQDPYWKKALLAQNIALYLPPPFDSSRTEVELLAVPPAGESTTPPAARRGAS
jgi:type VI secretion system protein ImpJ